MACAVGMCTSKGLRPTPITASNCCPGTPVCRACRPTVRRSSSPPLPRPSSRSSRRGSATSPSGWMPRTPRRPRSPLMRRACPISNVSGPAPCRRNSPRSKPCSKLVCPSATSSIFCRMSTIGRAIRGILGRRPAPTRNSPMRWSAISSPSSAMPVNWAPPKRPVIPRDRLAARSCDA